MSRVAICPTADAELTLAEMLADPIVQAVMACDGVRRADVRALIATLRSRCSHGETVSAFHAEPGAGAGGQTG